MESEEISISKKAASLINRRKGRLIAVGTTVVRALEAASDKRGKIHSIHGKTSLFIKPGHQFNSKIDALVTNFHLPKSSLLLLVCAYAGKKRILNAYLEAIRKNYRFYSFGDAMMIVK